MDLIRLRRAIFNHTINVGGIVATGWEDGTHGWELYLDGNTAMLVLKNGTKTYAVGPSQWVSCAYREPPAAPAPEYIAPPDVEQMLVTKAIAQHAEGQRIPIKEIRKRQRKVMADRSIDPE